MSDLENNDNPYEAPKIPATSSADFPTGIKRFDWRIVPFAVIACLSAASLLFAFVYLVSAGYSFVRLIFEGPNELTFKRIAFGLACFAAFAFTTYIGARAMAFWQARKDQIAAIASSVFLCLAVIAMLCVFCIA